MSLKKLYDVLSSLSANKQSGNLVIMAREGVTKRPGTCVINKGNLVQAAFQHQTGRAAISGLLELEIHDVNFMEFQTSAESHPDIPTIADILQKIQAREAELIKDKAQKILSINLQNEVIRLLEKRFGATASSKVNAIAQKISPVEHPIAFLDKCKSLIEMASGKEKAEQMFADLYKILKKP